jgi:hypothetical protein
MSSSNAGYSMFRGSMKSTGYPLHSPVSPSLPIPCVTVCHHISTGLYLLRNEYGYMLLFESLNNKQCRLNAIPDETWYSVVKFLLYFRNRNIWYLAEIVKCAATNASVNLLASLNGLEIFLSTDGLLGHLTTFRKFHISSDMYHEWRPSLKTGVDNLYRYTIPAVQAVTLSAMFRIYSVIAFPSLYSKPMYRAADKSLARPTSRCILFDASLVLYIYIYI